MPSLERMTAMQRLLNRITYVSYFFLVALALILIGAGLASCGKDDNPSSQQPKCDGTCQKKNDVFVDPTSYTDYFVNDSDGHKDSVYTIYHDVPFPTAGGVKCDVVKVFEEQGIGLSVVCPAGVNVINGSSSRNVPSPPQ